MANEICKATQVCSKTEYATQLWGILAIFLKKKILVGYKAETAWCNESSIVIESCLDTINHTCGCTSLYDQKRMELVCYVLLISSVAYLYYYVVN